MLVEVLSFGFARLKGTRHLPQQEARLTKAGAVGDRCLCLVDTSQQKILRTVGNLKLMSLAVSWDGASLKIQEQGITGRDFPEQVFTTKASGKSLTCDFWGRQVHTRLLRTEANSFFSHYLGQAVELAQVETGAILFGAPYSLIGSASLEYLADRLHHPELLAEAARLRSTFLVKTQEPFEEDYWTGTTVQLEAGVNQPQSLAGQRLLLGPGIGRCSVIDANPLTGSRDLPLLKELAKFRPRNERGEPLLGLYAELA